MNVRSLCLALLAHEEATGYDLKKRWAEGPFAHFVEASFGSIYPALARLEQDGLVECREEAQSGKPSRKVYSITPAGRAAFVSAMSEPPGPDTFRSPFAVVALCAPLLDRAIIERAIDDRLAESRAEVEMIEAHRADCRNPAVVWLIDWGIQHFRNEIAFIESNRERIETIAGSGLDAATGCDGRP
jgi:PadR family transcriptional regulator, regulatory protein AphA